MPPTSAIVIAELEDPGKLLLLERLFCDIWHSDHPPITGDLMRAIAHSGNYVAGVFAGGDLIGGAVGFLGRHRSSEIVLHSHIVGVLPTAQTHGVGYMLKQHQRRWALDRRLTTIYWTFDPLVRHNAYFNLVKLGADPLEYKVNFYGDMDGINAGDESDRLLVRWQLDSPRVVAASEGSSLDARLETWTANDHLIALRVDIDGKPATRGGGTSPVRLCQVPEDIVSTRGSDRAAAREWRNALRETLGRSLNEGYSVAGMTRSGWYVLVRNRHLAKTGQQQIRRE